jgi:hypothetical protein
LLCTQLWLPVQALPQPPQLAGSTVVSVHPFAQAVCPVGQQLELLQPIPAPQAVPQAPQLFGSLVVSVQALLQGLCAPGHD